MSWSKDAAPVYLGLAEAELVQGREQESLDVFEWYLGAPQRVGSARSATPRIARPIRRDVIGSTSSSLQPDGARLSAYCRMASPFGFMTTVA